MIVYKQIIRFLYQYKISHPQLKDSTRFSIIKGLCMRLLIHYIGDISQPLHTATRLSDTHPGGDLGGNLFNITSPKGYKSVDNLHSLWDTSLYQEYKV